LAGGYPVSHDDTGNIVLEVYGRDVPHAMGQNRSKGPTDQLANRYREAPDPISLSLSLSSLAPALEHTHTHASIQPETWDPLSLSRQFVTPTSKLNTRVQELELDVGTKRVTVVEQGRVCIECSSAYTGAVDQTCMK